MKLVRLPIILREKDTPNLKCGSSYHCEAKCEKVLQRPKSVEKCFPLRVFKVTNFHIQKTLWKSMEQILKNVTENVLVYVY